MIAACRLGRHTFRRCCKDAHGSRACGLIAALGSLCAEGRPIVATDLEVHQIKQLEERIVAAETEAAALRERTADVLARLDKALDALETRFGQRPAPRRPTLKPIRGGRDV